MQPNTDTDILILPEVIAKVRLSRATIYREMKVGAFPLPFKLTSHMRKNGWRLADIDKWITDRSTTIH